MSLDQLEMENNLKKSTPKKTASKKVVTIPATKTVGAALDTALQKGKAKELPKPDFAAAVQADKLDRKTLDVVADLLSDDAAKRERARASAKAMEPGSGKRKKADFSMMDSIRGKTEPAPGDMTREVFDAIVTADTDTVTGQIQKSAAAGNAEAIVARLSNRKKAEGGSPAEPAPKNTDLAIHVNKTGRVCFGKVAAARLDGYKYMVITVDGQTITFVPHSKPREGAVNIGDASGRPYVSATKLLKQVGFDGSKPLDLIATPVGDAGLQVKVG